MNNAFRMTHLVCILLVLNFFVGCGGDDPVDVRPAPNTPNLAGNIGLYMSPDATSPTVLDNGGIVDVYVLHNVEEGATASAFKIEAPANWTRVGAESQFAAIIGDVDDGISVAYGTCLNGCIHVMTLRYQSPGNSTDGAVFRVLPNPQWPDHIQVVDCSDNLLEDAVGKVSPVVLAPQPSQGGDRSRPRVKVD